MEEKNNDIKLNPKPQRFLSKYLNSDLSSNTLSSKFEEKDSKESLELKQIDMKEYCDLIQKNNLDKSIFLYLILSKFKFNY